MAQQASFVQDSVDRVREAVSSLESDFDKVQKRAEKRIREQRKRFDAQRKSFEKNTEKQVKRLRSEINKNPVVKRAQGVVDDASKQLEKNLDSLLGTLNLASQRDIKRVDRKLNQINKKLREIENSSDAS
jgi:vacuolar-type H+-ATPase subunit H